MATFPTFEDTYRPKLQNSLRQHVDQIERKVTEAQRSDDADAAERRLDEACDQCVDQVKQQMNEIKASVKQKGASSTTPEERKKYTSFVEGVTAGIRSTQGLFEQIFTRIREIAKIVVDWIRKGCGWMANVVSQAFASIRLLFE